jgi:hypothetical protein
MGWASFFYLGITANRWIYDVQRQDQFFLRLKTDNETAAAKLDQLLLRGALLVAEQSKKENPKRFR